MSDLLNAIWALVAVFQKYSTKEGDRFRLNKEDLKTLIQKELGELTRTYSYSEELDVLMNDFGQNKDGEVGFKEYVQLFGCLAVLCNKLFQN